MAAPRVYPSLPGSTLFYCDYVRCLRLPESPSPSQNIPPFSTTICDPPRIYPSLPEYTPLFQQLFVTLPESTPPSQNILPFSAIICHPPRIYPSLPENTPIFNNYMRPSQNIPPPPRIYPLFFLLLYATLPESTPPSQNIPPFQHLYATLRIYPSLPEYTPSPFSYYMQPS